MRYINSGSCVALPAGVTLGNKPNCDAGPAGLICPFTGSPRSLFVLSIAIQLFESDTGFMTTSVHLLLSDASVAHTPLIYSEARGDARWEEVHVPSDRRVSDKSCCNGRFSPIKYIYASIWTECLIRKQLYCWTSA